MPFFDRFRGRAAENSEYEDVPCRFVAQRPSEHPLRDVDRGRLQNILSVGIVNPFGPTFTILGVEGQLQKGSELPIWSIMLNPFQQTAARVGTLMVNRGVATLMLKLELRIGGRFDK